MTDTAPARVFLGGSCDPTTWRTDTAIPLLEALGFSYYNPQVAEWSPELVEAENVAKARASVLLFVIDGQTRAIASILEATEMLLRHRFVLLVIDDIADETVIAGQVVTGRELKDLNRARAYLRDLADRNGVPVHENVEQAIRSI